MKFYPCIEDPVTGRISVRVTRESMTHGEASDFLKRHYSQKWLRCEAIPQPETHPYFTTGKAASGQRVRTR